MTGICVDTFKDTIYVFADGMIANPHDGLIYTLTKDKIVRISEGVLITYSGDCAIGDACIELLKEGKLTLKNVKALKGEGAEIVVISKKEVVEITFELDEETKKTHTHMIRSHIEAKPFFFGTGNAVLSSAYAALKPNTCRVEKSYLNRMKKVFKAACERMAFMGELRQVETISLIKDKSK